MFIFLLALLGTVIAALHLGHLGSYLLLWIPLPFYAYSVAYGSVPIFIPVWWPFSYYNVRYGLELLPMFAIMIAVAAWSLSGIRVRRYGAVVSAAAVSLVAAGYISSFRGNSAAPYGVHSPLPGPICYREALVNSRIRLQVEQWLAPQLAQLPPSSRIGMQTSQYVGALQLAGVHLDRVVNESSYYSWDAELSAPAAVSDYVVTVEGDALAEAVARNPRWLTLIGEHVVPNGPRLALYRSSFRR
jgi:hypothetical protein